MAEYVRLRDDWPGYDSRFAEKMSPVKAHAFRSVIGHYIAGTAGAEGLAKVLDNLPD